MGQCYGKNISVAEGGDGQRHRRTPLHPVNGGAATPTRKGGGPSATPVHPSSATPLHPSSATPLHPSSATPSTWPSPGPPGSASPLPPGIAPSPARSTPRRFFRRPFPPPSPAKHIKAAIARRHGPSKPKEGPIPEDGGGEVEFQWFLMALSVRPGRSRAMVAHLLPYLAWAATMAASSAGVKGRWWTAGLSWLHQRSRHDLPDRPGISELIRVQLRGP